MSRAGVGYGLVLGSVTLSAVHAVIVKILLQTDLSASTVAELRSAGASLVVFVGLAATRRERLWPARGDWLPIMAFGVVGVALGQVLFLIAIDRLTIGVALVVVYTTPVLVAVWNRIFQRERVRRRVWLALALTIVGLSLIVDLFGGLTLSSVGLAAGLACAVAFAVYILAADAGVRRGRSPFWVLAWGFLSATLFWSIAEPWWRFPADVLADETSLLGRLADLSSPVWALVLYSILLGTIVPLSMFLVALARLSSTRVALIATFEPVAAAAIAFVWLREDLSATQYIGGAIVLGAVALAYTASETPIEEPHPI